MTPWIVSTGELLVDVKLPAPIVGIVLRWVHPFAMGEGTGGSLQVAALEGSSADSIDAVTRDGGHDTDLRGRTAGGVGRRSTTIHAPL